MRAPLVVDTNVIISALVSDAWTRRLLVELEVPLGAPAVVVEEVERHVDVIAPRPDLEPHRVHTFLETLLDNVDLVRSIDDAALEGARSAMGPKPGPDVLFLALAIEEDGAIWSDDKDFDDQSLVPAYTTTELISIVKD